MRRRLIALAALASSALAAPCVRAQPSAAGPEAESVAPAARPPEWDRVQELVNQGIELRSKQQDDAALAKFEEAYGLYADAWPLAQRALAKAALDDWLGAEADLRSALASRAHFWLDAPLASGEPRRAVLERELTKIQAHLARLEFRTRPEGAAVRIGGAEVGKTPFQGPVFYKPGSFLIEVELAGHYPQRRRVQLDAATPYRLSFELEPLSAAPEVAAAGAAPAKGDQGPAPAAPSYRRQPLFLVVAGAGAAIAASATIPWLVADAKVNSLASDCKKDCSDYASRRSSVETLDTVTTALLVTGSVVAVGGAAAYFLWLTPTETRASTSVSVALRGRGAEVRVRW